MCVDGIGRSPSRFEKSAYPVRGFGNDDIIKMSDRDDRMPDFSAAQRRMWELVERYTDRVGYRRGTKAAGLDALPPVIDCSGWVGVLLTEAMRAQNDATGKAIFDVADIGACVAWSDRIVLEIESRTPTLLTGREITAATLPDYATIGLNLGTVGWETNFPRTRGINHIVQVVRRPADQMLFVSEAIGPEDSGGVRLMPVDQWLAAFNTCIAGGNAWAVDPFAMANRRHSP
jgi:hypothetical protein